MKRIKLFGAIIASVIICSLFFTHISASANSSDKPENISVYENMDNKCANLSEFLKKEFEKGTKPLEYYPSVRVYGLQEKDVLSKVLNLCSKLKAKKVETENDDLFYELPDNLGTIEIREIYNNGIFVKVIFATDCNLPFTEIRYVSLKMYDEK